MTRLTAAEYAAHQRKVKGTTNSAPISSKLVVRPDRYRSKWERDYEQELRFRKHALEIMWYGFEAIKLRLADRTYYTPDFAILYRSRELAFHEVKGRMRDDAAVKIKVAAELFPFSFFLVTKKEGKWTWTRV